MRCSKSHAICWHAVLSMCLLGHEPLTPPPPGGLIWGEGRCVLLLVRNNHSRPITFTAFHAFIAELSDENNDSEGRVERNHTFSHQGNKFLTNICKKQKKNISVSPLPPPLLSCLLSRPTRPLSVLFGHWRLSVGVYVQFTGAERSQFCVLLWNKTSLPLRSDEKWSGWAGWAGRGTIPCRRPAVRKSKRLLCCCWRLPVW